MDFIKNKGNMLLLFLKVAFSIFITYLIIFKGDAGFLIHNIGAFFVGGNYIIGLSSLANITIFYILALYNITSNCKSLTKLKNNLLIFDFVLVLVNTVLAIYIAYNYYQMPIQDAVSKYIILSVGASTVYYAMSILVIWLKSKMQNNSSTDSVLNINNNPFSFTGKIGRCAYLITKFIALTFFLITILILRNYQSGHISLLLALLIFIIFSIGLFAASKRLRDIKWKQWLLIIWAIPYIGGICIGLPLLIIKGKQDTESVVTD